MSFIFVYISKKVFSFDFMCVCVLCPSHKTVLATRQHPAQPTGPCHSWTLPAAAVGRYKTYALWTQNYRHKRYYLVPGTSLWIKRSGQCNAMPAYSFFLVRGVGVLQTLPLQSYWSLVPQPRTALYGLWYCGDELMREQQQHLFLLQLDTTCTTYTLYERKQKNQTFAFG